MREMYKDGVSKPVHTYQQKQHKADGWSFKKEVQHAKDDSKAEAKETAKEEKVLTVHEQAELLGIATHDEDGKKIHHKTLAKLIAEAKYGDTH